MTPEPRAHRARSTLAPMRTQGSTTMTMTLPVTRHSDDSNDPPPPPPRDEQPPRDPTSKDERRQQRKGQARRSTP
eukprot:8442282-Heterocapsa_arctica.AAC.1